MKDFLEKPRNRKDQRGQKEKTINQVAGEHLGSSPPTPPQQALHHSSPREHDVNGPTKPYNFAEDRFHRAPASAQQETFTSVLNVFYDGQTKSFHE